MYYMCIYTYILYMYIHRYIFTTCGVIFILGTLGWLFDAYILKLAKFEIRIFFRLTKCRY